MVHRRSWATLVAASLLLGVALPALFSPPAQARPSDSYDFAPGQSAYAMRTDPSWVRCFHLRFDAVLPGPAEQAMAAVYLLDGTGRFLFAEVHHVIVWDSQSTATHVEVTTADGSHGVTLHGGYPSSPGPWTFNISREHCISTAAVHQTTVFVAVTSQGVTSARATLTSLDGDLKFPRYVTGNGFLYNNTDFNGVVVESQMPPRAGGNVAVKALTFEQGFIGSFFSYDTAYVLGVTGDGFARAQGEAGVCGATECLGAGSPPLGTFALRGGAGAYRFHAATAAPLQPPGPGSMVYLFGADIRVPVSVS